MIRSWIAVGMLTVFVAAPAGAFEFRESPMQATGAIRSVVADDLDGDGKLELIVSITAGTPPNEKRRIQIFHIGANGYDAQPRWTLDVPAGATVFDTGDVDGDRAAELLWIYRNRVGAVDFAASGPGDERTLVDKGCGVCWADRTKAPVLDLVRDWRGDASVELMLPGDGEFRFFERREGAFVAAETVAVEMERDLHSAKATKSESYGFSVTATIKVPEWALVDYDNDRDADLYVVGNERIWVVRQTDGRFESKSTASRFFKIRSEQDWKRQDVTVSTHVRDLDGDGFGDLVFNKFGGSITNFSSDIRVYRGGATGLPASPTYSRQFKGFSGLLKFADADRDGRVDMIAPGVEVSIGKIIRVLTVKKLDMEYGLYRCDGPQLFSQEPTQKFDVPFHMGTGDENDFSGTPPEYGYDFDGDGRPDLLVGTSPDEIAVKSGKGGLDFTGPTATIKAPAANGAEVMDLDGDGKTDLVIWYGTASRQGQLKAFLSR